MKQINSIELGNNILLLITKLNLSQEKFAKRVGLARPHLTNIINGKTNPTLPVAFKIALGLDTPINQVFYPIRISQN